MVIITGRAIKAPGARGRVEEDARATVAADTAAAVTAVAAGGAEGAGRLDRNSVQREGRVQLHELVHGIHGRKIAVIAHDPMLRPAGRARVANSVHPANTSLTRRS